MNDVRQRYIDPAARMAIIAKIDRHVPQIKAHWPKDSRNVDMARAIMGGTKTLAQVAMHSASEWLECARRERIHTLHG